MQRYFMNQSADENQCFFIENKEDYHHIVNVMRYKEGQNIIVTFSDENVFKC
ncbi:MAG: RNA methyltransferase PUA domain-containing protein, partial [Staphylococcus epidermidis]|nr:RNA methyltransferase PUA domain-containing protein [Staphylococcus epidermidis]